MTIATFPRLSWQGQKKAGSSSSQAEPGDGEFRLISDAACDCRDDKAALETPTYDLRKVLVRNDQRLDGCKRLLISQAVFVVIN